MRTTFKLKNFRLFDNEGAKIDIRPITIITGSNSSGKSSIVKAICILSDFLKQGIRHHRLDGIFKLQDCKFNFNIENMKLGGFENVLNINSKENTFELQYTVSPKHLYFREFLVKLQFSIDKDSVMHNARLSGITINLNNNDSTCIMKCLISEDREVKYISGSLLETSGDFLVMLILLYWQCLSLEMSEQSMEGDVDAALSTLYDEVKEYLKKNIGEAKIVASDILKDLVRKEGQTDIDFLKDYKKYWPAVKQTADNSLLFYMPVLDKFKTMTKEEAILYLSAVYSDYEKMDKQAEEKLYGLKYFPDLIEDFKNSDAQNFLDYYRKEENQLGLVHETLPKIIMLLNHRNDMIDEFTYGHLSCDYDSNGFSGLMQGVGKEKKGFAQLFSAMAALQMKEGDPSAVNVIDYVDAPEYGYFRVSSVMYNAYLKFINIVLHELLMPDFLRDFIYVGSTRVNVSRLYSFDDRAGGFSHLIEEYFKNMSVYKTPWGVDDKYQPGDFLNKWLKQLGIADSLLLERVQDGLGAVAYLQKDGRKSLLADEGYGITQIVSVLMNIENEILIKKNMRMGVDPVEGKVDYFPTIAFEEPELSLHPKLQSKLAEIFYDANVNYGIDFIIETHSEYLVRKTQIIVANMEAEKPNPFNVVYVPAGDKPYNMDYMDDGRFARPFGPGFFDEADNLATELFLIEK